MNLPIVGRADRAAEQNRARLDLNGVFAVSLIAPPGAGKAALVHRTVERLAADTSTLRIKAGGPPPLAGQLAKALADVRLRGIDLLLVENAGDFVCPGTYKLGAHANVRVTTVFEEPERMLYDASAEPTVVNERGGAWPRRAEDARPYQGLDALVVNKIDRAREAGFDDAGFLRRLAGVNPNLMVFFTSCVDGRGLQNWIEWLGRRRTAHFHRRPRAASTRPREEAFA